MSTMRLKWALLVVVLAITGYFLLPTLRYYQLDEAQRGSNDPGIANLRENSMRLGLDLQGGSYLVYEVDIDKIPEDQRRGDEIDRAIEVIRNRVDQYGVSEPVIQKQGTDRIVVQLPGLDSPENVKELVGKTARLEFRLVQTEEEMQAALGIMDRAIARRQRGGSQAEMDTTAAADSLLNAEKPFSSLLQVGVRSGTGMMYVPSANFDQVYGMYEAAAFDTVTDEPRTIAGSTSLVFGEENEDPNNPGRYLYAVSSRAELTGANLKDASVQFGIDRNQPGAAGVLMELDRRGSAIFTRVTGANVGRQLAVVLDNVVRSDPFIREKIRGGSASITGLATDDEAKTLGIVLRAGALPTDLAAIEERTVGPTLGRDSIRQGIRASLLGLALVIVIMVIWYRASGFLAVLALTLNLVFLFAVLGAIRGTLTLPGIAGIVLTIGMAVDANVLVFERIREELRTGKTVRGAIDEGYRRALVTILDSNLTTLISSIVLFQFGTGPIRGFALTLMVGIVANVFTAVFVTRLVYDSILSRRQLKGLSI